MDKNAILLAKEDLSNFYRATTEKTSLFKLNMQMDDAFMSMMAAYPRMLKSEMPNATVIPKYSKYVTNQLIMAIINKEVRWDGRAERSVVAFNKDLEAGSKLMAIASRDQFYSMGPFQFKKETFESLRAKYDYLLPGFEKSTMHDHLIAFALLSYHNLGIFEIAFMAKSKKLEAAFDKASEKDKEQFVAAVISVAHNTGFHKLLKFLGNGLGDVPRYRAGESKWAGELRKSSSQLALITKKLRGEFPYANDVLALQKVYADLLPKNSVSEVKHGAASIVPVQVSPRELSLKQIPGKRIELR
ncbi:MAG: hypothetical protein V1492_02095 [Candidatus Micrarchaeota archaeon]